MNMQLNGSTLVSVMKWSCRLILVSMTAAMTYIVLLPQYNFSHYVPHPLIKRLGFSYEFQLWVDHNMDKVFHFFGAFILVHLLFGANVYFRQRPNYRLILSAAFVLFAAFAAEYAQDYIGRGFNKSDIWIGVGGAFLAILIIKFSFIGKLLSETYYLEDKG